MTARDRARAAKVGMDAARVERDKKIEEQTTQFYLASDQRDQARSAAADAEAQMAAVVLALAELDVSPEQIVTLCAIEPREVRALRKQGKGKTDGKTGKGTAAPPPTPGPDPAATSDQDGTEQHATVQDVTEGAA